MPKFGKEQPPLFTKKGEENDKAPPSQKDLNFLTQSENPDEYIKGPYKGLSRKKAMKLAGKYLKEQKQKENPPQFGQKKKSQA